MNHAQQITVGLAALTILFLNVQAALPSFHKGFGRPVGPDIVRVYPHEGPALPSTVPVIRPGATPSETTPQVEVYLWYGFRDDAVTSTPRLTLALLIGFASIYWFLGFQKGGKAGPPPAA